MPPRPTQFSPASSSSARNAALLVTPAQGMERMLQRLQGMISDYLRSLRDAEAQAKRASAEHAGAVRERLGRFADAVERLGVTKEARATLRTQGQTEFARMRDELNRRLEGISAEAAKEQGRFKVQASRWLGDLGPFGVEAVLSGRRLVDASTGREVPAHVLTKLRDLMTDAKYGVLTGTQRLADPKAQAEQARAERAARLYEETERLTTVREGGVKKAVPSWWVRLSAATGSSGQPSANVAEEWRNLFDLDWVRLVTVLQARLDRAKRTAREKEQTYDRHSQELATKAGLLAKLGESKTQKDAEDRARVRGELEKMSKKLARLEEEAYESLDALESLTELIGTFLSVMETEERGRQAVGRAVMDGHKMAAKIREKVGGAAKRSARLREKTTEEQGGQPFLSGRYKGLRPSEVPMWYLVWVARGGPQKVYKTQTTAGKNKHPLPSPVKRMQVRLPFDTRMRGFVLNYLRSAAGKGRLLKWVRDVKNEAAASELGYDAQSPRSGPQQDMDRLIRDELRRRSGGKGPSARDQSSMEASWAEAHKKRRALGLPGLYKRVFREEMEKGMRPGMTPDQVNQLRAQARKEADRRYQRRLTAAGLSDYQVFYRYYLGRGYSPEQAHHRSARDVREGGWEAAKVFSQDENKPWLEEEKRLQQDERQSARLRDAHVYYSRPGERRDPKEAARMLLGIPGGREMTPAEELEGRIEWLRLRARVDARWEPTHPDWLNFDVKGDDPRNPNPVKIAGMRAALDLLDRAEQARDRDELAAVLDDLNRLFRRSRADMDPEVGEEVARRQAQGEPIDPEDLFAEPTDGPGGLTAEIERVIQARWNSFEVVWRSEKGNREGGEQLFDPDFFGEEDKVGYTEPVYDEDPHDVTQTVEGRARDPRPVRDNPIAEGAWGQSWGGDPAHPADEVSRPGPDAPHTTAPGTGPGADGGRPADSPQVHDPGAQRDKPAGQ